MYVSTVSPPIFLKLSVLLDQHLVTYTSRLFRLRHFQHAVDEVIIPSVPSPGF